MSGRSVLRPYGNEQFPFVDEGNVLSSRLVLLIFVCQLRKLRWVVEQPCRSFLPAMPRFQEMLCDLKAIGVS